MSVQVFDGDGIDRTTEQARRAAEFIIVSGFRDRYFVREVGDHVEWTDDAQQATGFYSVAVAKAEVARIWTRHDNNPTFTYVERSKAIDSDSKVANKKRS